MNKAVLNNELHCHKRGDITIYNYDGETGGNIFPHQLNIILRLASVYRHVLV